MIKNRNKYPWYVVRHHDEEFHLYAATNPDAPGRSEFLMATIGSTRLATAIETVLNQLWTAVKTCKSLAAEHRSEESRILALQRFELMEQKLNVALTNAERLRPFLSRLNAPLVKQTFNLLVDRARTCKELVNQYVMAIDDPHQTFVGMRRIFTSTQHIGEEIRRLYGQETFV